MAEAAELLTQRYHLILTNVPYLGREKQTASLRKFCETHYPLAKHDLATVFLERLFRLCTNGGELLLVLPRNWLFLARYKALRKQLLESRSWQLLATLGPGAFETITGEVVNTCLLAIGHAPPSGNDAFAWLDVSPYPTSTEKAAALEQAPVTTLTQANQLDNPDRVVGYIPEAPHALLERKAYSHQGLATSDNAQFVFCFWEVPPGQHGWEFFQFAPAATRRMTGCSHVIFWDGGQGKYADHAAALKREGRLGGWKSGSAAWGKPGIAVNRMGDLPASVYYGTKFDCNVAVLIPEDERDIGGMWAYCSSPRYSQAVRLLNKKVSVTNGALAKVPYDAAQWEQAANGMEADELTAIYTNDPTQWGFHGHPHAAEAPLQVAMARLLGCRWPAESAADMELSPESRHWIDANVRGRPFEDNDGIVCLPPVSGERPAHERLLDLLAACWGDAWNDDVYEKLLAETGMGELRGLASQQILRGTLQAVPQPSLHLAHLGRPPGRFPRLRELPQARRGWRQRPAAVGETRLQLSWRLDRSPARCRRPRRNRSRRALGGSVGIAGQIGGDIEGCGSLRHLRALEADPPASGGLGAGPQRRHPPERPPVHGRRHPRRPPRGRNTAHEAQHPLEEGQRQGTATRRGPLPVVLGSRPIHRAARERRTPRSRRQAARPHRRQRHGGFHVPLRSAGCRMTAQLLGTTADNGEYLDLIQATCQRIKPERICAAVAYATHSGVADLSDALSHLPRWQKTKKQWLVGIDYCRSDPLALEHLRTLPKSSVRIFDGKFVSTRAGCVPRHSFHPKAYLLIGSSKSAAVVGSGNLSRTGLRLGIEAAAAVHNDTAIAHLRTWFRNQWSSATPLDSIEKPYRARYDSTENRQYPQASEDDAAPESASRGTQLNPHQLRKLRVCRYLWIDAGNVTRNRGRKLPGNQLMMKRNSRVFFGFVAKDLPPDSAIGEVVIEWHGRRYAGRTLRFGNNSMDILALPVPEEGEAYDRKTLHFEQVDVRVFKLKVGSRTDVRRWKRRSDAIDGILPMRSERQWGVY